MLSAGMKTAIILVMYFYSSVLSGMISGAM